MADTKMRIKVRRDIADNWSSVNPVLLMGEQGYETDTGKMKIGDGVSPWSDIGYFNYDVSVMDGSITNDRLNLIDDTINKLKLLKSYTIGRNLETQADAVTLVVEAIQDAVGRLSVLESVDSATKTELQDKINLEMTARAAYDEFLHELHQADHDRLNSLSEQVLLKEGGSIDGDLSVTGQVDFTGLVDAFDDADAAYKGVKLNHLYRTLNTIKIRLS